MKIEVLALINILVNIFDVQGNNFFSMPTSDPQYKVLVHIKDISQTKKSFLFAIQYTQVPEDLEQKINPQWII